MASWTVVKDDGSEVIVEATDLYAHPQGTLMFKSADRDVVEIFSPVGYLSCKKN